MTDAGQFNVECIGGPRNGEPLEASAGRVPILVPGSDTEGQLVGFYVHAGDWWDGSLSGCLTETIGCGETSKSAEIEW